MPSGLLTLLKYAFLVVLYLFFLRVLRAVWVELREPPPAAPGSAVAGAAAGSSGGRPVAGLVRLLGPPARHGQTFDVGTELTVGRATTCGIVLADDTYVSSVHARFFRRDGGIWIEDLGSTNGTLLNDHRVAGAAPVREGDVVTVGRTTMELAG